MKCARCNRKIKGATVWYLGHPFGPVCAKLLALDKEKKRAKVVRDNRTFDLFGDEDGQKNSE
jgi:hypothetical protein